MPVTLLCTQCLYVGTRSSILSLSYVLLPIVDTQFPIEQDSLLAVGVEHGVSGIEVFLGILLLHGVDLVVNVAVPPASLVQESGNEQERLRERHSSSGYTA